MGYYLTKKQKKNEGEIPQYYMEGNHEAIIPPEKFDMVQREMTKRGTTLNEQISQTQAQKAGVGDFLAAFEKMPEALTESSLDAFNALTDYLTVNCEGDIDVTFRNGQTIKA